MINEKLINPGSIVVIGGSDDILKPGGKVLKNILDGKFPRNLYVVNPKQDVVQGLKSYKDISLIPDTDLAILAIPAKMCLSAVETLCRDKKTLAFIILSAGFSEESHGGSVLEQQIVDVINKYNGCLIGPNCIGFLNINYNGVFTTPLPKLDPKGIDFISGSGATAVFIMEAAIPNGLTFSSLYSVGNSAQIGVEDVLEYLDLSFDPKTSSRIKLLYIETIGNPGKLLKHASSLIRKGCRIAAIKSGTSEAGSRAASSHTGAMASPDTAVEALFRKAGIVRCNSRSELIAVASVFTRPALKGKRIAIITHAGGPAVMLTDALSKGGMEVPQITGKKADALREKLFPGSSVANPIDFLATGNAEQLGYIIDACENDFDNIDAMAVIFGSPGLFPVYDVYDLLDKKMRTCSKPIFPVLPSIINVSQEIKEFLSKGNINFPDEVPFANALCKVSDTQYREVAEYEQYTIDKTTIRTIIDSSENGYLSPEDVSRLLKAAGIPLAEEAVVTNSAEAVRRASEIDFPVAMKVVGPVHKSDVGGVVLNLKDSKSVSREFIRMMKIPGSKAVLVQKMVSGTELFAGIKAEGAFGHLLLAGLGGIFIEALKDVSASLVPVSYSEAKHMVHSLKGYAVIKGMRGQRGIKESSLLEIICRLSALAEVAPEISEMDLNPLMGTEDSVVTVDARIRIEMTDK
ncbi:MAG: acetate--CoA ligase family protein [Bacteroidales bacterium]|nr:acetate--CoA ligase family protein [Bacteroidales bacterium]